MALKQLAGRVAAIDTVDHAATLDGWALEDLLGPALHIQVTLNLQEFTGVVEMAQGQRAVPGPNRHVGNRVVVAGQIGAVSQAAIQHIELALDLHGKAVDRILEFARGA